MKILLTGGAGYVGSAVLRWLLKNGHDPIAYDDLSAGNAAAVPGDNRLVVGDLLDTEKLKQTLSDFGIESVMHFGAVASVPESIKQPELYWRVNVLGTKSLLDAMLACGVRNIVFSSTAATFAFTDKMPLTEDSPQIPQVPYGTTKLACEWIIKEYAHAYNMGYTIFRYFNASGADADGQYGEDRPCESHLIPLALFAAQGRRDKLFVFGSDYETRDGSCVRDYVHNDDLAQAHQLAAESLAPGVARDFNLGSGDGTTVLEVIKACEKAVGKTIPVEMADRRPGDPGILIASSEKAMKELGWDPKYSDIDYIVQTAWKWHNEHPTGYGDRAKD